MKMRRFALFVSLQLLSFSTSSFAQSVSHFTGEDIRTALRKSPWKEEKIRDGVRYRYGYFTDFFGEKQSIHVLDVDLNQPRLRVAIAYEDSLLTPTSRLADRQGAVAAVNGNFFHTEEGGSVCFLKVDGKVRDTSRTDLTERLFLDQLDEVALTIDPSGIAIIQCPPGGWHGLAHLPTILSAGPLLVYDGKVQSPIDHSFNNEHYGRTGAGLTEKNHLVLVAVDGNTEGATGMTIAELAQLFLSLGCTRAMNLDGGGSTTMWIRGKPHNGIVNHPSDNKKFDHQGEIRSPG